MGRIYLNENYLKLMMKQLLISAPAIIITNAPNLDQCAALLGFEYFIPLCAHERGCTFHHHSIKPDL
jgi:hypothetical protein